MKPYIPALLMGILVACSSSPAYGPASKSGAVGYDSQKIEPGRYQVSYTDRDPVKARDGALLRAAELTLLDGADWFEITSSFTDRRDEDRRSGSSVSIGGSTGSYGRSSVGVGVGIGIPLGGNDGGLVTESLEILTGSGDKPDRPMAYDARSVDINLRGKVTE